MTDPAGPNDGGRDGRGPGRSPPRSPWAFVHLGAQLTLTVGAGVGLGLWLDGRYGWSPWGVACGGALGTAVGLYYFLRETL